MTTTTGEGRVLDPDAPQHRSIPHDTFAGRLKLVRLHAGDLTIQEAAERCGLLNQNWSNWEHGRPPRNLKEAVEAISDGLGIDRDWLMWGGPLATPERSYGRRGRGGGVTPRYPIAAAQARPFSYPRRATRSSRREWYPREGRPFGRLSVPARRIRVGNPPVQFTVLARRKG